MIQRSSGQKLGVTRNRQWSVVGLHDLANGNVVERYAYDMSGKRTIYAANGTTVRTTSSFGNHFGYTNRWHDEESGLINFRARHYNPLTGEFLSRDPLEFVDGMSLNRGYFGIDGVDPDGLDRKFPSGKHITGKGHHIIPHCFWGKFGFCEEAMEIFDGHCIACDAHDFTGHGKNGYNGHVQDVLTKYLKDHKLAGAKLTIEEQKALAEKLVEHVKTSNNEYIKGFLKHVECQDDLVDWVDGPGKKCVPPTGCEIKPLGKIKKICIPKVTKFCRKIPGVKYITTIWILWLWNADYNNARADDYSPVEAAAIATARAVDPGVEAACEGGFYVGDALSPFHDRPEIRRQQMAFPGAAEQQAMLEAILREDLRIQMGMQPSWECPMPAPPPVMGMPPFR